MLKLISTQHITTTQKCNTKTNFRKRIEKREKTRKILANRQIVLLRASKKMTIDANSKSGIEFKLIIN
uniref:Ribosomal protein L20 n=1 Tax=Panagrolaimus sp. JU765 TaxID=591449 RepID=A0AC34RF05_9BILA